MNGTMTATTTASPIPLRRCAAHLLPTPRATPLATAMVVLLLGAALTLRLAFPDNVADVVAWTSTNVENLAAHPVGSMLASAFVVPSGLIPELVLVALGFTLLERSIGTLRTAAIALSGHVLATLLTEYGAYLLADSATDRPDVGVSYAMFAVLAATAFRLAGRVRVLTLLAVAAAVLIPVAVAPGMTTTGHLLAAALGPATMVLLRPRPAGRVRRPARPPRTRSTINAVPCAEQP
jgi:hypothetical protein